MIPSCLPPQLRAEHEVERPPLPRAATHQPIAFDDAPVTEKIRPQVSSATASVRTSGVFVTTMPRDLRGRDVDVVVADGDVRDDLQLARRVEHLRRDPVRDDADQAVLVGEPPLQLVRRERSG